jgi:hypothetical protein
MIGWPEILIRLRSQAKAPVDSITFSPISAASSKVSERR